MGVEVDILAVFGALAVDLSLVLGCQLVCQGQWIGGNRVSVRLRGSVADGTVLGASKVVGV